MPDNTTKNDMNVTGSDIGNICKVCDVTHLATASGPADCAALVQDVQGATAMCKCWELQQPAMENYYAQLELYENCLSGGKVCKPGPVTIPNATYDKNSANPGGKTLKFNQNCWDPYISTTDSTITGTTNQKMYSDWVAAQTTYEKEWGTTLFTGEDAAGKRYGAGGDLAHYNAPAAGMDASPATLTRGVGQQHTSGTYLPYCGDISKQGDSPCSPAQDTPGNTLDQYATRLQDAGAYGNGAYCQHTIDKFGGLGATSGAGWAFAKTAAAAADAKFMSKEGTKGCGDADTCGGEDSLPGAMIKGPGLGRKWVYNTGTSDTGIGGRGGTSYDFGAFGTGAGGNGPGVGWKGYNPNTQANYGCTLTAPQSFKTPGVQAAAPTWPLAFQSKEQVCHALKPDWPKFGCCMNSVVAGNDLQNVNVNLTQTCNFGGFCKSGPDQENQGILDIVQEDPIVMDMGYVKTTRVFVRLIGEVSCVQYRQLVRS